MLLAATIERRCNRTLGTLVCLCRPISSVGIPRGAGDAALYAGKHVPATEVAVLAPHRNALYTAKRSLSRFFDGSDFSCLCSSLHTIDDDCDAFCILSTRDEMSGSDDLLIARNAQIHSTISQDFSQGRSARESAALANLGSKVKGASSSGAEKVETSNLESRGFTPINYESGGFTPVNDPGRIKSPGYSRQAEHHDRSPQDYQIQSMVLEQQNMKRLMMARSEGETKRKITLAPVDDSGPVPKEGTAWPMEDAQSVTGQKRSFDPVEASETSSDLTSKRPRGTETPEPNLVLAEQVLKSLESVIKVRLGLG
jgi:hypothetical protein